LVISGSGVPLAQRRALATGSPDLQIQHWHRICAWLSGGHFATVNADPDHFDRVTL
jgi:hypothetical protein